MKAITLTQPWATLIAIGAKVIETRGWQTMYRGELAIHAAKGFPDHCVHLTYTDPFRRHLMAAGFDTAADLPLGVIVARARLIEIYPTDDERCEGLLHNHGARPDERAFGDYTRGRFAWWLGDVIRLKDPIPCRGALMLWTVPDEIAAKVRA